MEGASLCAGAWLTCRPALVPLPHGTFEPRVTCVCQVDGHVGYYDVSGGGKKLKGEFTLTSDSEMVPSTKRPHAFTVKSSGIRQKGHSFTFAAGDEATKEAWIAAIEAHIEFVRAREALDMDRVDYAFPS